ncbi:LuxR C-terminal-related transcriptional regulator, partial [Paenibacillus sp. HJGM_3]|uniref:helix-turn-helix transcriptional regulator n=1 Tax=Paenibacillus sp. HJGM_3 TaxID=3379816 RepID=UPI00385E4913
TYSIYGSSLLVWGLPARECRPILEKAIGHNLDSGNGAYIGYCIGSLATYYAMYEPLDALIEWVPAQVELLKVMYPLLSEFIGIYRQYGLNLKGVSGDLFSLSGGKFENETDIRRSERDPSSAMYRYIYYALKARLYYFFGHYREAIRTAELSAKLYPPINGLGYPNHLFFWSLSIAAAWNGMATLDRLRWGRKLRRNERYLARLAAHCPANFESRYLTVAAESARLRGRREQALALFRRAVESARTHQDIQVEAIASEHAAAGCEFYGETAAARHYAEEAIRLYGQWGAQAKAAHLRAAYRPLLEQNSQEAIRWTHSGDPTTAHADEEINGGDHSKRIRAAADGGQPGEIRGWTGEAQSDDRAAIPSEPTLRSKDVVSGEEELIQLHRTMMTRIVQATGAQTGSLLCERDGELYREMYMDADRVLIPDSVRVDRCDRLSPVIASFAFMSRELVLLGDAAREGLFVHDDYVRRHGCRSVCCLPISTPTGIRGLIYLENGLAANVFSEESLLSIHGMARQLIYLTQLQRSVRTDALDAQEQSAAAGHVEQDLPVYLEPLTDRERDVLLRMAEGMTNHEIAASLSMTVGTVKVHSRNIFSKLNVNRRTKAVKIAREMQLIQPQ